MEPRELKTKRERLNMTQVDLAQRIDVDVRTIKRWESGVIAIPRAVDLAMQAIESEERAS